VSKTEIRKSGWGGLREGSGRPQKTRCLRGHDLTDPANVYVNPQGIRSCRKCQHARREEKRRNAAPTRI